MLRLFLILVYVAGSSGEGLHSIWIFATHITGQTQFPEFSAVLMLDDVQLGYYDSNVQRFIYKRHGDSDKDLGEDGQTQMNLIFGDTFKSMRKRSSLAKDRFNSTKGIKVQQRIMGFVLVDDNQRGQIMMKEAFNGVGGGDLNFSNQNYHYAPEWSELLFNRLQTQTVQALLQNVYLPICVRYFNIFLEKKKRIVLRKERPRVRVIHKTNQDGGSAQVSCLASGFYPRFINLTLLRDGQPVDQERLVGGRVLPNADGTYQMRKTMELSGQELRERHQYTCTTSHLSLDNRLDISWEPEAGPDDTSIVLMILALVLLIILTISAAIAMWRWKCFLFSQPKYRAAQGTDSSNSSQDSVSTGCGS